MDPAQTESVCCLHTVRDFTAPIEMMMNFLTYYDEEWVPKGDYFHVHRNRFLQSWEFLDSLALPHNGMVLDVGGAGPLSLFLKDHRGWTSSWSMTDLRFSLGFESNAFDLVICTETIEHIKDLDSSEISDLESFNYSGITGMLRELKRLMKDDGLLFLTTPNANSYITLSKWLNGEVLLMDPNHVREFSIRDLRRTASTVGLEAKVIKTFDSWGRQFGTEVVELASLLERVTSAQSVEREDNIFALFSKTENSLGADS